MKSWGWLVVAAFALIYYSRYYRSGLNLGGEGGTVAVIAMRLLEGQRPLADTFLGYNVMWFYPVAWLFQLTGPDYIALRIFFFALCTVTGLMAFFIVRRVTGSGWFSVLVALGPVVIPGMLFRNYMAFLAMANMLVLLQAYVFGQTTARRQISWMAGAGFVLGLTYLVRVDLGVFFTVIHLGLIALYPFGWRGEVSRRARMAGIGLLLTVLMFLATHAPFYLDARKRGYDGLFVSQYTHWVNMVRHLAVLEVEKRFPAGKPSAGTWRKRFAGSERRVTLKDAFAPFSLAPVADLKGARAPFKTAGLGGDVDSGDYLQKRPIADFWKAPTFYQRAFVLITYLPVAVALLIVLPAAGLLLWALARRDFALHTDALVLLVTAGCALTLFPQFFFFRPDTPHLSEFMAPFLVAMACAAWVCCRLAGSLPARLWAGAIVILCTANTGLYFYHSYPKESAGTIAARWKRKHEMTAQNGVRVLLKKQECEDLQALCDLIEKNTLPGEYVVTYPYAPTVNFMTDRPSYEFNLYVDNAHNVSGFFRETVEEIEKYRPAAILIDNRPVNQTEGSRFHNWAATTSRWIREHYVYAGTFRRQEVYLRPAAFGGLRGEGETEKGLP